MKRYWPPLRTFGDRFYTLWHTTSMVSKEAKRAAKYAARFN